MRALVQRVSRATLFADARRGTRPSRTDAAAGPLAEPLYERFRLQADARRGVFGGHMEVEMVNDGPPTVLLEQGPSGAAGP